MVYQGASGDLIKAAVDLGAKGIVMAGAGAGRHERHAERGPRLRRREGRVHRDRHAHGRRPHRAQPTRRQGAGATPTPEQQQRRRVHHPAEDHIPVKARILLMLALDHDRNRDEIQRIFSDY